MKQRREDGYKLERVVAGLMFWSDSTQLAQFGDASAWPIYLFFGNLSKYAQSKTESGCYHLITFLPSVGSFLNSTLLQMSHLICAASSVLNSKPSNELGWNALALTKWLGLGLALRAMVVIVEEDALGLQQLSPKLISTCIITKYGKLHYGTLIRVVESCTMALIQHSPMLNSLSEVHKHLENGTTMRAA